MPKPIRILHVLQKMEAGGTQALLMNIYRNIDRNKVQFDFLVVNSQKEFYDDEILSMGGKIYYSNLRESKNIYGYQKLLKKILIKNKYKIIHVHAYTIGYFTLKTAAKYNVPVRIAHSHNNSTTKDNKYLIKKILQKLYLLYATDLFACSKEAGEYLFKNQKFTVLNNSIDSQKFLFDYKIRNKVRKSLNLKDELLIGHVGRLHEQKNHKFLIEIFEEIKKKNKYAKLLLVGNGPLENQILTQIKQKNLNNDIIYLKNRTDVNELYMAMDVFVLPSLFEGLGIVAVEAQAAGTPCVTSNTLPIESIVTPLCKQLSLKIKPEIWANEVIEMSKNYDKHENMQEYIIKADYDIVKTSEFIQNYYLQKNKIN
ncbi:glycosyltransferase family 1 protein [Turicibacter sanguinis]|uniref:glycosyltransferase family 1 protein n=1 Tax=Turicibacter sanguinis TaxID=154288 RepID=UPI001897DA43|nr:glycosyltransferase family 1 protein [Turicibacter sanguinis]